MCVDWVQSRGACQDTHSTEEKLQKTRKTTTTKPNRRPVETTPALGVNPNTDTDFYYKFIIY